MAYRKTEAVLAALAERKEAIIAATEAMIIKKGEASLTIDGIAAKSKQSIGTIYKHFADLNEIVGEIAVRAMTRDLQAIREAGGQLAEALTVIYSRIPEPRMARVLEQSPVYWFGIRDELAKLMRRAAGVTPGEADLHASAALGAIFKVAEERGANSKASASAVARIAQKGLGLRIYA